MHRKILYGGDYNPNQWPREVWKTDMRYLKEAGIDCATINVFSWAKIQPEEERYDFSELDDIVAMLNREGIGIVLATPTAAVPAWMPGKYPQVLRTDYEGRRHRFGQRVSACPNSPVYRKYAERIAGRLAERYGNNPGLLFWHISNEYGTECYCEQCEKEFRNWLKERYGTLENLNGAWNMEFWGHTVYDWEEIVPPNALSEGMGENRTAFSGISLDYRRFMSDSQLKDFILERDAIRRYDPSTPVTTNLMGTYKGLDYFKWAREMDVVSWDNYPAYDTPPSFTAMSHDLMRSLKKAPFMLMEQTPSQQNWQPYNSLKRPGELRAQSYQAIAHGADTVQFFQLRRSIGGCEKFHGAVIEHSGRKDTRVFREVSELGEELKGQEKYGIPGSENKACAGIIFDWDTFWALEYSSGPSKDLAYVDHIHEFYRYFYEKNISVDLIPWDADFSSYRIVAAPVLYMVKEGMKQALEAYVHGGGTLVLTYMSGIVTESDNVYLGGYPGPLRELAGVWVEEIDALPPERSNIVVFEDGSREKCGFLCDLMHLETAKPLAFYEQDFYQKMPAAVRNDFGRGNVYYIGTRLEKSGLFRILDQACADGKRCCPSLKKEQSGLEITFREGKEYSFCFLINFQKEPQKVPDEFAGETDVLTGRTVEAGDRMSRYQVRILARRKERVAAE